MAKYISGDALTKGIKALEKDAKSMVERIHNLCLGAAFHALEHGNTTPINELVKASKNVTHNNGVARWMEKYCNWVMWDSKAKEFALKKTLRAAVVDDDGRVDPEVLKEYGETIDAAPTYLEFTPPPKFVPVNAIAMLRSAVKKIDGLSDEDKADPRNNLQGADALRKLLRDLDPEYAIENAPAHAAAA